MGVENACMSGLVVPYGRLGNGARAWARFDDPAPHVLVAGPCSSGKTSTAGLIAARCAAAGALVDWLAYSAWPACTPAQTVTLRHSLGAFHPARVIEEVFLYGVAASMQSDAAALPLRVLVIDEVLDVFRSIGVLDKVSARPCRAATARAQLSWLMSAGSRRTRTLLVVSSPVAGATLFTREQRDRFGTRVVLGSRDPVMSMLVYGSQVKPGLRARLSAPRPGAGVTGDALAQSPVVVDRAPPTEFGSRNRAPSWFTDRTTPLWGGVDSPRVTGEAWDAAALAAGLNFVGDDVGKW